MSLTPSKMVELGMRAPDFTLPDTVSGEDLSYKDVAGENGTVVMFICNHCPFVKHVNDELVRVANEYQDEGIGFVAISANDADNYPQDGPEKMKQTAAAQGYPFAYLYDQTQEVAKEYKAACTPDFFVYDENDKLVYRGQLDDSRPGNDKELNGKDLREALDRVLAGEDPIENQKPSTGCNIKWKD